jgi:hypothetical protein
MSSAAAMAAADLGSGGGGGAGDAELESAILERPPSTSASASAAPATDGEGGIRLGRTRRTASGRSFSRTLSAADGGAGVASALGAATLRESRLFAATASASGLGYAPPLVVETLPPTAASYFRSAVGVDSGASGFAAASLRASGLPPRAPASALSAAPFLAATSTARTAPAPVVV